MHIFTYGSLMFPEVWQRIVQGHYRFAPAAVDGYARFAIAGETYPGMAARAGAAVSGVLYFDVDACDVAALDAFEGEDYRRETVRVALDDGGSAEAGAYIYLLPQNLLESPWDPERFQMERFIGAHCCDKRGE
jgi:gamma-glutamylcyclotransferase (GGCT)/AIG2-like uncharacterized protein YtfP